MEFNNVKVSADFNAISLLSVAIYSARRIMQPGARCAGFMDGEEIAKVLFQAWIGAMPKKFKLLARHARPT